MREEKINTFIKETMKFAPGFRKNFSGTELKTGLKLSNHQFFALFTVYKSDLISMGELALKIGVSNQQITRIMDVLVKNDLVVRFPDIDNRRLVLTKVSEHGLRVIKKLQNSLLLKTKKALSDLSDEEIDQCIFHLKSLSSILSITGIFNSKTK